jgi:ABC-type Zn uptake system ZnuABC Zn-binding protein ZnuA
VSKSAQTRNRRSRPKLRIALLAALPLATCLYAANVTAQTILTGTQATYSLTSALVHATPIQAVNIPEDGRQLSLMRDYIARRTERFDPIFAAATAVVSLTNVLPGDPLYRFARDANIRIVDIDAAAPWSLSTAGVALIESPSSNVNWGIDSDAVTAATAPYFWLSVSNAIRMGDIIAHDLIQLFPELSPTIESNLDDLKWSLLNLRNDYQNRLIDAGDDTVFALTGDFVYLTNDMGLYVDGYFIKQDIRWTESDLAEVTSHLQERSIRVVLHKWTPSDAIVEAVTKAGAVVVVLDTGDPGLLADDQLAVDGLQTILKNNLDAIHAALSR